MIIIKHVIVHFKEKLSYNDNDSGKAKTKSKAVV